MKRIGRRLMGRLATDSTTTGGRLRLRLLGISTAEASFERRGFALGTPDSRRRLEQIGQTFVHGYRAALADRDVERLERVLGRVDEELEGFGYEGAGMALALLDGLAPWRRSRVAELLAGPGSRHVYMVHVGTGWALARLRRRPRAAPSLDPLLRWLALDGAGFHEGYFHHARRIGRRELPRGFRGYAARAFDQGLGRSLWFVHAAEPLPVAASIGRFEPRRQADLWSGAALAAAYAGAADAERIRLLAAAGRAFAPHLAQGAAFAATARQRAGNPAAHTGLACRLLAGVTASEAAVVTEAARRDLGPDGAEPAYERWRGRVRRALGGDRQAGTDLAAC
jgi:hypothetical protein